MRSASFRAATFLVLLTLALVASPVFAAGGRVHRAESAPGVFAILWQALGEIASWMENGRVNKLGSGMDPDGQTTSACSGESGSIMDPNGCPRSQNNSDLGSGMDPNG
jgi:hypothetical protein